MKVSAPLESLRLPGHNKTTLTKQIDLTTAVLYITKPSLQPSFFQGSALLAVSSPGDESAARCREFHRRYPGLARLLKMVGYFSGSRSMTVTSGGARNRSGGPHVPD